MNPRKILVTSQFAGILFETRFEVHEVSDFGWGHIILKNVSISNFNSRSGCRPDSGLRINVAVNTSYFPFATFFEDVYIESDVDRPLHIDHAVPENKQITLRSVCSPEVVGGYNVGNANTDVFAVSKGFAGEEILAAPPCKSVPATSANVDNRMYRCPDQCWRLVALMYNDATDEEATGMPEVSRNTSMRITH